MGMSLVTALEIFSNPYDLAITIGRGQEGGRYAIAIARGPDHDFKPLLTSAPFSDKLEEVVAAVKRTLETVYQVANDEFRKPNGLLGPIEEINHREVLNPTLIGWICDQLTRNQAASTFQIPEHSAMPTT